MKISGRAYSGKKIGVGNYYLPVVIDLAGLQIPQSFPLLSAHRNLPETKIGQASARIENNSVLFSGELFENNATKTIRANPDGWQSSVGVDVLSAVRVYEEEGKKVLMEINGQKHEAPFIWIKAGKLRENSILPLGADDETFVTIQAGRTGEDETITGLTIKCENTTFSMETIMDEKEKTEEIKTPQIDVKAERERAVKAERERISDIDRLCAGREMFVPNISELREKAVNEGWTGDQLSRKLVENLQASRPQELPAPNIQAKTSGFSSLEEGQKFLEASISLQCRIPEKQIIAEVGEKVAERASRSPIGLKELFVQACRLEGVHTEPGFGNGHIRAGFSTVSLPGILNNVANKALLKALEIQPSVAAQLCSVGNLKDFKEHEKYRMTGMGDVEKVAENGEIKSMEFAEQKAVNQLNTWGIMPVLTRQMIINDDLGAFNRMFQVLGNKMYVAREKEFFTKLLANAAMEDGIAIFHADHDNYETGVDTVFSIESLKTACEKFMEQTNAAGEPVSAIPRYILVPTAYYFAAVEIVKSVRKTTSGQDFLAGDVHVNPELNAMATMGLIPLSSPYLSNSAITGYSSVAWYLFGDPNVIDTFEIGYLNGNTRPTLDSGMTSPEMLGMYFRAYWDFGINVQDFRGMVKMLGA